MRYCIISVIFLQCSPLQQITFKKVKDWVHELKQHGPENIVIAIAGNKNDLEDLREITVKQGTDYAKEIGAVFCETSAKTAENIKELFVDISKWFFWHVIHKASSVFPLARWQRCANLLEYKKET